MAASLEGIAPGAKDFRPESADALHVGEHGLIRKVAAYRRLDSLLLHWHGQMASPNEPSLVATPRSPQHTPMSSLTSPAAPAKAGRSDPAGLVFGAAALVICLWGSVYSALRVALQAIPAGPLAFLRLAIATFVLGLYGLATGVRLPERLHWPRIAAIGFVGFAAYLVLLNIGQRTVNAGTASFIINTGPAMSALLAVVFLKERLTPSGAFGIVLSLLGIALLISSGGPGWHFDFSAGGLVLLMAALAQATHFVLQKSALRQLSAYEVTLWSMCVATILLGPFAKEAADALLRAPKPVAAAVVYLGVFPSAVAHLSWTFVLAHMPAAKATSLLMLVSPVAVLIGGLWLGESLPMLAWVGGALAFLGVALVQRANRIGGAGTVRRKAKASARVAAVDPRPTDTRPNE